MQQHYSITTLQCNNIVVLQLFSCNTTEKNKTLDATDTQLIKLTCIQFAIRSTADYLRNVENMQQKNNTCTASISEAGYLGCFKLGSMQEHLKLRPRTANVGLLYRCLLTKLGIIWSTRDCTCIIMQSKNYSITLSYHTLQSVSAILAILCLSL